MLYLIGSDLVPKFVQIASINRSVEDLGIVETLAFLMGHLEHGNFVATDLIFPHQIGQPHKVDDLGKLI